MSVVEVMIRVYEATEMLGPVEFDQLPRVDENINIPADGDPTGFRSFNVIEVTHYAAGMPANGAPLDRAMTLLVCTEHE